MRNSYFLSTKLYLAYCLIRTKFISPQSRLFRFPFEIRGCQYIDLGKNLTTGKNCRFEAFESDKKFSLIIGNNVQVNDNVHITAMHNVRIGNNVLMASKVYISDCTHGIYTGDVQSFPDTPPISRKYDIKSVHIEDNVWLGDNVCVLPGVTIGEGSIIGAGSVVTKSIPKHSIAVGVPAKIIKQFSVDTKKWELV